MMTIPAKSPAITEAILADALMLWDFHGERKVPERADFILAMGSHDERVAEEAARTFLNGLASILVTSGGYGKVTRDLWHVTEGERFAQIARTMGVPDAAILVEPKAANTGDNVVFTRQVLQQHGFTPQSGLLVTKPYMCRRAYATAAKQWPEIRWFVSAPEITFDNYPNDEVPLGRMINLMVGDLQRLKIYGENGFQIPVYIPDAVWASFERLRDAGFDDFVIRS